jgi:hypothetical protein
MPVVGRALLLAVPGGGWPGAGQVEEAVPVDARHPPQQERGGAPQAEALHFLGAERGRPHLRDPDRQVRHRLDLLEALRPLMDRPMVPVQGEPMHRHGLHTVQHPLRLHVGDETRVDGRDAAEHAHQAGAFGGHRLGGELGHGGEEPPLGVELKGPVRFVVGLIPQHDRFDHGASLACCHSCRPDRRRAARPAPPGGGR